MLTTGITRVRFGEVIKPKKSQTSQISKATIARYYLFKLDKAVANDTRVLMKLKMRGLFTNRLESLIEDLIKDIKTISDSLPMSGNRIPKTFRVKVIRLANRIDFFESQCQLELNEHIKFGARIWRTLKCLIDDVRHFANQFTMTYFSYQVEFGINGEILPPNPKHIPYRKTDERRKNAFYSILESYKNPDGKIIKFPRFKTIEKAMMQAGFEFPERTYRLYKTQIKNGTFDYFVQ